MLNYNFMSDDLDSIYSNDNYDNVDDDQSVTSEETVNDDGFNDNNDDDDDIVEGLIIDNDRNEDGYFPDIGEDSAMVNIEDFDEVEDDMSFKVSDNNWRLQIETIANKTIEIHSLYIYKMKWISNRLEIILSTNNDTEAPEGPSIKLLEGIHRILYTEWEAREADLQFITNFEVIIISISYSDII